MKKTIVCILMIIISLTIFGKWEKGITGSVHGKISGENGAIYNMRNIYIELKDQNGVFLKKAYIQPSRDFYFFDVVNGRYIIEVTAQGDTQKFYFEKKHENIYIGDITIAINEQAVQKNIILNILFGITAFVNFVIIFFIRKGNEFESKKTIIKTLYIYNVGYVLMFSGFLLSFFEKNVSYSLIPIAYFIWDILMIMLVLFFINYPVKNKTKWVMVIANTLIIYKLVSSFLLLLDRYYSNIFMVLNIVKDYEEINGISNILYYIAASSDVVMTIFIAILLIRNVRNNKGSIEGMASRFFARTFIVTIPIVVLIDVAIGFTWPGRFEGYSEIVDSIFNLIIMLIMLLGVSGAKLLYGRKNNSYVFREVIKYYIFMLILYIVVMVSDDIDYALLMVFGVAIKLILDFVIHFFIKGSKISYEKAISKLEAVIEQKEFARIVSDEIIRVAGSRKVDFFFNTKENADFFNKIKNIENKIFSGEIVQNLFKGYDIGIKLDWEGETAGFILIESSEKKLDIKEINFLINFSEEVSKLAANIGVKAAKDRIVREKATAENYEKEHKNSEELMYIEKLAQLIISQTAEEKTKKLAETILKESKKSRGDTNE